MGDSKFPSWMTGRFFALFSVAIFAVALQWSATLNQSLLPAEHLISDGFQRFLASDEPESRILIVDIDEASIRQIGPWPWPRHIIADLVENLLVEYRAKAVGLDIVFPSRASDAFEGDQRLAALAQNAPVVFAQAFDFVARDDSLEAGVPVFSHAPGFGVIDPAQARPATGYVANHEGLSSARCVGNIGISPDSDGRIRRVPLATSWKNQVSHLLPLAMIDCISDIGTKGRPVAWESDAAFLSGPEWKIPFKRQLTAYPVVSAVDILSGQASARLLQNRWVLVGSSALGLNDRASTPLAASTSGVMVHAAALTSLLDFQEGRYPRSDLDGRWLGALWIVISIPLLGWILRHFRAWSILPAVLVLGISWLALALGLLSLDIQVSVLPPLVAYALIMLLVPIEWWLLQRQQGRLLGSFATYVAPSVLQEMLRQGVEHPLEPRLRDITVLNADMQNYTGMTRESTLEDAANLTREFLRCLTGPVLEFGGTLDKYTGDGLVAFWGAPLPCEDHALRAVQAGENIIREVRRWNEERVRHGLLPVRVRVGIESGAALVGDLGTPFRRTYTAVGDCINLASKLQAAVRNHPVDLAIGPNATRACSARRDLVSVATEQLASAGGSLQMWTIQGLPCSTPAPVSVRPAPLTAAP